MNKSPMWYSIIAGILLGLAFPKAGWFGLAYIALVPFFFTLINVRSAKAAAWAGFFFGMTFFGINLFWITSLSRFVGIWAVLGWLCLIFFQSLFVIAFSIAAQAVRQDLRPYLIPLAWVVVVEWLRSLGIFGVTAGDLGYSQVALLPLVQIASFSSVYGVSLVIAAWNTALASRSRGYIICMLLVIASAWVFGLSQLSRPELPGRSLKFSLIQSNIDQMDKMDPGKVGSIFAVHAALTEQARAEKPDVIVWPETALLTYLLHDQVMLGRVKQLVISSECWVVMGTPHYEGKQIYNSVISISPSGEVTSRYDKQHPVPFGEFLPFRPLLFPILRYVGYYDNEFTPNPDSRNIRIASFEAATAICFESTFPAFIRERVAEGADFILIVTNDGWFNDSDAPYQHLDQGIMRAVENRKYFIQAANTGLSAVIDPYGRVVARSRMNERTVLTSKITLP
jgi:apolipoprotein N-acyltransferase